MNPPPATPSGRRTRLAALAAGVLAASALQGCGDARPAPRTVVLITIDTLRADHLKCYGYARDTSPNLDALAAQGARFERALVPIPRTTQSLASLLTGLGPDEHGVSNLVDSLAPRYQTVAEEARAAGYATTGVVVIPFMRAPQGLDQGFDAFHLIPGEARADAVTDAAIAALGSGGPESKRFLWLHYRDPHAPYFPPRAFRDRFDADASGTYRDYFHYWPVDSNLLPEGGVVTPAMRDAKEAMKFGAVRLSDRDMHRAIALYDAEIAWTDHEIGRFLDALKERGLWDDALVIVTADHGESLGEHDFYFDHGEFLYDTCLRVPLIVRRPGLKPVVVHEQVPTLDVAPTLVDVLGRAPLANVQGRSFADALRSGRAEARLVLAESGEPLFWQANPRFSGWTREVGPMDRLRAVCAPSGDKVICDPVTGRSAEAYHSALDPLEVRDLASTPEFRGPVEAAMRLAAALHARATHGAAGAAGAIDDETRRMLEQAGYPSGSSTVPAGTPGRGPEKRGG